MGSFDLMGSTLARRRRCGPVERATERLLLGGREGRRARSLGLDERSQYQPLVSPGACRAEVLAVVAVSLLLGQEDLGLALPAALAKHGLPLLRVRGRVAASRR